MSLLLLRTMVAKETRTTFREKHQLIGLAVSVIAMTAGMVAPAYMIQGKLADHDPSSISWTPQMIAAARWLPTLIGMAIGIFFSLGYLLTALISSFAGEKENRTLELTLASPVCDTRLFLYKCISVLLPSATLGWCFTLVAALIAYLSFSRIITTLPVPLWFYLCIASIPLILLPGIMLMGIGAAISALSETAKGAGQATGGIFAFTMLSLIYGVPSLVKYFNLLPALQKLWQDFSTWPFPTQYLAAITFLSIPAILSLTLGRLLFRRTRLLV